MPDQTVAENRLIRVSYLNPRPDGVADNVSFEYNGLGQRVHIVEKHGDTVLADKRLLWVDSNIAEERASNGSTVNKRYFDQGYTLTSGGNAGNYFYAKDHLGSIRQVTDSSGTVRANYDYDLWGRRTKLSGDLDADFGFTSFYRNEASDLDLTWYRAYSAEMGRWLSRDPIYLSEVSRGAEEGNIYMYVKNSAAMFTDPFGLYTYNNPDPNVTGRLTAEMGKRVECLEKCLGVALVVTGGTEKGHSGGAKGCHGVGDCVDFGFVSNPKIQGNSSKFFCCAKKCGFEHAIEEGSGKCHPKASPHYHLSIHKKSGKSSNCPEKIPEKECPDC